jgi:hypothetical protein
VLTLTQLPSRDWQTKLDARIPPEWRRLTLVVLAFFFFFVASFQVYDDLNTKYRMLVEAAASRNPSQAHITTVTTGSYLVLPSDDVLLVDFRKFGATIVLPSGFPKGKIITVKDKTGVASVNPIRITAERGKIDGVPELQLAADYGYISFIWNGEESSTF